jgi:hypothetical protein
MTGVIKYNAFKTSPVILYLIQGIVILVRLQNSFPSVLSCITSQTSRILTLSPKPNLWFGAIFFSIASGYDLKKGSANETLHKGNFF